MQFLCDCVGLKRFKKSCYLEATRTNVFLQADSLVTNNIRTLKHTLALGFFENFDTVSLRLRFRSLATLIAV